MNQGRIWCVVHPTVGLPLLLGSVTAISLIVHATVLTHTPWFSNYWSGSARPKAVSENMPKTGLASTTSMATPAFAVTVAPVPTATPTQTAFVVTVTPGAGQAAVPNSVTRSKLALNTSPPK